MDEQVEDVRQQLRRNPRAVVAYVDCYAIGRLGYHEHDLVARCAVLGRVIEEIRQALDEARTIPMHMQRLPGSVHPQLVKFFVHERLDHLDGRLDDLPDLEGFRFENNPASRDPRDVEEVVEQVGQVLTLPRDHRSQRAQLGIGADFSGEKHCCVAYRRQRISQLMREHREELILLAIGPAQCLMRSPALGDIPIGLEHELAFADARELPAALSDDLMTRTRKMTKLPAPDSVLLDRLLDLCEGLGKACLQQVVTGTSQALGARVSVKLLAAPVPRHDP